MADDSQRPLAPGSEIQASGGDHEIIRDVRHRDDRPEEELANHERVWYLSYGSNMNEERLNCYLFGGTPEGGSGVCRGSRDRSPIQRRSPFWLYRQMFFAKHSRTWHGGVCFIGHEEHHEPTMARMFVDIFMQENRFSRRQAELIDHRILGKVAGAQLIARYLSRFLPHLALLGSIYLPFASSTWYGTVLTIGHCDGAPILTFSSHQQDIQSIIQEKRFRNPTPPYLRIMAKGLAQAHRMRQHEIVRYYQRCGGVDYPPGELHSMLEDLDLHKHHG